MEMKFQNLTPTGNMDLTAYKKAFEYIFNDGDIKNVAISGPYCAGKSSLLKSFKEQEENENKRFLHISLAHFKNTSNRKNERNDAKEYNKESMEMILEGKILNQLLQQIDEKYIPQTSFHVKKTVSIGRCIINTVITMLFILSLLHLNYWGKWRGWVDSCNMEILKSLLSLTTGYFARVISAVIAVILFGVGLFGILRRQKYKNILRKFSVKGNEIQLFSEDESSYFDKYLNEVLYLFENANADVIVFEDLDRYNDTEIFKRLRDINYLVNKRIQKENKKAKKQKTLRFFYLLRDDMFTTKDRTKFFDFILPVIPVLDCSSACEQLKKQLNESQISYKFNDDFLEEIAIYIDDMRILRNIINEFIIYDHALNVDEKDSDKLLAILTYKNLFPRDFVQLQFKKGYVAAVLENVTQINEHQMEEINMEKIFLCPKTGKTQNKYENIVNSEYFGLLKFLIQGGYINGEYSKYMTHSGKNNSQLTN